MLTRLVLVVCCFVLDYVETVIAVGIIPLKTAQSSLRGRLLPPTKPVRNVKKSKHTPDCCCAGLPECFAHCPCASQLTVLIPAIRSAVREGHSACFRHLVSGSGNIIDEPLKWNVVQSLALDDLKWLRANTDVQFANMGCLSMALMCGKKDIALYLRAQGAWPVDGNWARGINDENILWAARNSCLDQRDPVIVARLCRLCAENGIRNGVRAYQSDCAARVIQGAWRRSYYNPAFVVWKRRMLRQFISMGGKFSQFEQVHATVDRLNYRWKRWWAAVESRVTKRRGRIIIL